MVDEETHAAVLSRLRLAQSLLEESDRLPGRDGYRFGDEKWWHHPRHEREALVLYLLLTCFDRLGQRGRSIRFPEWLKSKKGPYISQREKALQLIPADTPFDDAASSLHEDFESQYGVRNCFFAGVRGLPDSARQALFNSVRISLCPGYRSKAPNVSLPSVPLGDDVDQDELKLKFLYRKRNRFTHHLEQHFSASVPMMSEFRQPGSASWLIIVRDGKLSYMGGQQEPEQQEGDEALIYSAIGWPFPLFEALYEGIGEVFERTEIDLKFQVQVHNEAESTVTTYPEVPHAAVRLLLES